MPTPLLAMVRKVVGKAVPKVGAAYPITLHRKAGGKLVVDGDRAAGATTIAFRELPPDLTTISAGLTFRLGANATVYTVTNGTPVLVVDGAAGGVIFTPSLTSDRVDGDEGESDGSTAVPCLGIETEYSVYERASGAVTETDKKVMIIGATLPAGVEPQPGDVIETPFGKRAIVPTGSKGSPPVQSDPARATWICRAS